MAEQEKAKPQKKQDIDYPLVLLCVLLTVVGVLIFIGYDYLRDDTPTNAPLAIADTSPEMPAEESATTTEAAEAEVKPKVAVKPKEEKKSTEEKSKSASASSTPKKPEKKINTKAIPAGGRTINHTVKAGETFSSIARRYNLSRQAIEALNPQIDAEKGVKAGVTQLKVKVKAMHTVGPGDVLSKVASKYGVSKAQLMAANGKTKDFAKRGETLIIPFP